MFLHHKDLYPLILNGAWPLLFLMVFSSSTFQGTVASPDKTCAKVTFMEGALKEGSWGFGKDFYM